VLVEWDPYTFSILTEEPGVAKFKDIIDGLTVHEEVDEVTGLSRVIIVDPPAEKKQPTIEIKDNAHEDMDINSFLFGCNRDGACRDGATD
jgi:hypothetical protein